MIGTVALWGRVIEHELGFRGEYGYPQRIVLICPECFWWPAAGGSEAEVVAVLDRGAAVPLCEAHLQIARECRLEIRSLRSAPEIESILLSTYAVDPLARPSGAGNLSRDASPMSCRGMAPYRSDRIQGLNPST